MPSRLVRLPGDVEEALARDRGLVVSSRNGGIERTRVQRLHRAGLLVRLAHGIYAGAEAFDSASPWERFAQRTRAFVAASGPNAYAAGWSAVALLGLPTISPPPDLPLLYVPHGSGHSKNQTFGRIRVASLPRDHRAVIDDVPVVALQRTVVDLGRTVDRADALVVADAALATGTAREQLDAVVRHAHGWPGARQAAWIVKHADPYAETALETLGRLTFIEGDLPVPVSNAWIDLGDCRFRPDHLLDELWMLFEGDGAGKYNNRADAGTVIAAQREREWRLRAAGFEFGLRYGYREARYDRPLLADRFRAAIANRAPRPRRASWYRESITYRAA